MELIPLALAIVVLWKVESSHADGNADLEFYRHKLAEHSDRCDRCICADKAEPVYRKTQDTGEKSQAADGELRND